MPSTQLELLITVKSIIHPSVHRTISQVAITIAINTDFPILEAQRRPHPQQPQIYFRHNQIPNENTHHFRSTWGYSSSGLRNLGHDEEFKRPERQGIQTTISNIALYIYIQRRTTLNHHHADLPDRVNTLHQHITLIHHAHKPR